MGFFNKKIFKKTKLKTETYQVLEPFVFYTWDAMYLGYGLGKVPKGSIIKMLVKKNGHVKKIKINGYLNDFLDIQKKDTTQMTKKEILSKCRKL